jgi:signal transduction histidine kinase/CheY-like chemotaxis protein
MTKILYLSWFLFLITAYYTGIKSNIYEITPAIWVSIGGLSLNAILCGISYTQISTRQKDLILYCLNTSVLSLISHLLYLYGISGHYKDVFGVSIPSILYAEWIGCGVPNTWSTLTFLNFSKTDRWKVTGFYFTIIFFGFFATLSIIRFYAYFFYSLAILCFFLMMRYMMCIQSPLSHECAFTPRLSFMISLLYGLFPLTYFFCLFTGINSVDVFFLASSIAKSCITTLVYQYQQKTILEGEENQRRNFVKYIFHELRTPLNSIQISSDLLEDSEIGLILQVSCRYVQETLNNVLYLYSSDEKQWKMDSSSFSLHHFQSQVIQTVSPLLSSKHITGTVSISENCPSLIYTDINKLTHICVNLWSNAIKFTPEGGSIHMSINVEDGILRIRIKDTGCGISPESAERLFKNFSQLSQGYQKLGGSGLGLSICRQLAEFMGGNIELVESTVGLGSTFELSLPVNTNLSVFIPSISSIPNHSFSNVSFSVLLIDDHSTNLKMLEMLFRKFTDRIQVAQNGKEGIECIKRNGSFDLIFVDNIMPELNGPDFCRYIRKDMNYQKIVIGLTGNVLQEDISEFIQAGADYVLGKPVKLLQIKECLDFVQKNGSTSYAPNFHLHMDDGKFKWVGS